MTVRTAAALAAIVGVVAFAVRSLGVENVFPDDGTVVFALGDAFYHARRALFSVQHFPRVLLHDPLLNFPEGAFVPWPPLYDLFLASVARALGGSEAAFERVAAWAPVLLGTLTALPVLAAGRRLGGRGAGVAAAALFALFPASTLYSNVGNADHHAAQTFLGAVALWLCLCFASGSSDDMQRLHRRFVAMTAARTALLLTWSGSLVYLVLIEGTVLLVGVLEGRRRLLRGEAASTLATAALVLPVVLVSGTPVGGPYSAIEISRLHVLVLVAVAAVAAGVVALERWRASRSAGERVLRATGVGAAALGLLFAGTGLAGELGLGIGYVAKTDAYQGMNLEQYPLFSFADGFSDALALRSFGFFAYLIPLAPVAALASARASSRREGAFVLAGWSAALGALALYQVRFASDFAPAASVAFAVGLTSAAAVLARAAGRTAARLLTGAVATALLLPVLAFHWHALQATLRNLAGRGPAIDRALFTYEGTMVRFAEAVRKATPETKGFDDPSSRPEYGIIAYPGIGHVLHYTARRATPADNFGPYIGPANYDAVGEFFALQDEERAVAEAERLRSRYVVTTEYGGGIPWTLVNRLHRGDGSQLGDAPAFGRFRLVTEGPEGGRAIGEEFGRGIRPGGVPYKLFEIVPGALIEATAPTGTPVEAEVKVQTPTGRTFSWRTATTSGSDGIARLRVPYATHTTAPVRPIQPYRVTVGEAAHAVSVPENAVRDGRTLVVGEGSS